MTKSLTLSLKEVIISFELRLRAPQDVLDMVHAHYDKYRHENSGHINITVFFVLHSSLIISLSPCVHYCSFPHPVRSSVGDLGSRTLGARGGVASRGPKVQKPEAISGNPYNDRCQRDFVYPQGHKGQTEVKRPHIDWEKQLWYFTCIKIFYQSPLS